VQAIKGNGQGYAGWDETAHDEQEAESNTAAADESGRHGAAAV
jgi:hypothetical protein